MSLHIYEHLCHVYDHYWGTWVEQYICLLDELLRDHNITQAQICDLACGTGTLARGLVDKGHHLHCVDISSGMLEVAITKFHDDEHVTFAQQDMVQFVTHETLDMITCTFDSFNYVLNFHELESLLERVASALRPNGFFVFDSITERLYLNHHQGTQERHFGEETFLQILNYDKENKLATTVFEFADASSEIHKQRPYDQDVLKALLKQVGLNILHIFANFDKTPCTFESERLIFVTQKITEHEIHQ